MILAWLAGDLAITRDQLTDLATELVLTIGESAPTIAQRLGAIARDA